MVERDATAIALPDKPFRVVANIPFDRTTDLLRLLLDDPRVPLTRADLIVEWGVAVKRALPWPSTANDVRWGAWYRFTLGRRLPRASFDPAPSVDAGLLVVERRRRPLVPARHATKYAAFVARGFRHGVQSAAGARAPRRVEARDLDAHEWAALYLSGCGGAGEETGAPAAPSRRAVAPEARPARDGDDRSGRVPSGPQ